MKVIRVIDIGDDRIRVEGFDEADPSKLLHAEGWLSAITNYFGPETYGLDGHRHPDSKPREMTPEERLHYFGSLLDGHQDKEIFVNPDNLKAHIESRDTAEYDPEPDTEQTIDIEQA